MHTSRQKKLSASKLQEVPVGSIASSSQNSPGVAFSSLLLNSNNIAEAKEFQNVILNLNFAAIHLALLQEVSHFLHFFFPLLFLM